MCANKGCLYAFVNDKKQNLMHWCFSAIFSDSETLPMCTSGSGTATGNLLYLKNNDYPANIRAEETNCTCSIETTSCTSNINVYFVHFELDDDGSCTDTQKIIINDNGTDSTFTCSDNTYYSITKKLTSSGNYLTVSLENTDGVAAGYVFTGYEGRLNRWRKLLNGIRANSYINLSSTNRNKNRLRLSSAEKV